MIDDRAFVEAMTRKSQEMYRALGIKPGEGGRHQGYTTGYEAAISDMFKALTEARKSVEQGET